MSADVAKALVTMEDMVKLKFTPIEDATVGFWLMGMDIRQIDHPKCAAQQPWLSCPLTWVSHLWEQGRHGPQACTLFEETEPSALMCLPCELKAEARIHGQPNDS